MCVEPQDHGLVLCIHGEVVDPEVDFFEREQVFIADKLEPILAQVPTLKVVIEHATTREAVAFVENSKHPAGIGCTITPQHLLYNRNALFNKGLNPHFFCLPILKREEDRLELLRAGASVLYALLRLRPPAPRRFPRDGCVVGLLVADVSTWTFAWRAYAESEVFATCHVRSDVWQPAFLRRNRLGPACGGKQAVLLRARRLLLC